MKRSMILPAKYWYIYLMQRLKLSTNRTTMTKLTNLSRLGSTISSISLISITFSTFRRHIQVLFIITRTDISLFRFLSSKKSYNRWQFTQVPPQIIIFPSILVLPVLFFCEDWLQRAKRNRLKKLELPVNKIPLRFAGQPVYPLYGVQVAVSITEITGKTHNLNIFAYVLRSTPIPFLLGLTDQQRLGFDICLLELHSSHLNISHWYQYFPLVVISTAWLRFSPFRRCADDMHDRDATISKSMFVNTASMTNAVSSVSTLTCLVLPHEKLFPISTLTLTSFLRGHVTNGPQLFPVWTSSASIVLLNTGKRPQWQNVFERALEILPSHNQSRKHLTPSDDRRVRKPLKYLAN